MRFQLTPGVGMDDLLDLPWHRPLSAWDDRRLLAISTVGDQGRASVLAGGTAVALRELPFEAADRANRVLRSLRRDDVPVVEVLGVVSGRVDDHGAELPAVLLTVRQRDVLTHRALLAAAVPDVSHEVVDAAVRLVVHLHLVGFVWGDASLTSLRFRRDAGCVSALLVEVGDGERLDELSSARRLRDLEDAAFAFAAELAGSGVGGGDDPCGPHALRHDIRRRYRSLWHVLTSEERFAAADGSQRRAARLRRVNELGFDVGEVAVTDHGDELGVGPATIEPGHHRRRLQRLTRLVVQENQARRLLEDIETFRTSADIAPGTSAAPDLSTGPDHAARRWLDEVFHPTVAAVPAELRHPGQDDAEVFHEVLEHRYYASERAGHDIGTTAAVDAYVTDVLAPARAQELRDVG